MTDTKPTNRKDALGIKRAPVSTVPEPVIFELGLAMLEGALKYRRHNYRAIGVRASVYYDACRRHVAAWWEGEDIDPKSGLPHLTKAMACLAIIRDAEVRDKLADDRPPKTEDGWVEKLNAVAAKMVETIPAVEGGPYTEIGEQRRAAAEEHVASIDRAFVLESPTPVELPKECNICKGDCRTQVTASDFGITRTPMRGCPKHR